jgi:hypothetical protein
MRSTGLASAILEVQDGTAPHTALAAFVDAFELAPIDEARFALLEDEPVVTKDKRLNALVGAIAEYLAKQHKLSRMPQWVAGSVRYLDRPWHTSSIFIDWKR